MSGDHWDRIRRGITMQQRLRMWPGPLSEAVNSLEVAFRRPRTTRAAIKLRRLILTLEGVEHIHLNDLQIRARMPEIDYSALGKIRSALTYGRS